MAGTCWRISRSFVFFILRIHFSVVIHTLQKESLNWLGGRVTWFFSFFGFSSSDEVLELSFIFHISIVLCQTPTHKFLTLTNSSSYNFMSHSFHFTVIDAVKWESDSLKLIVMSFILNNTLQTDSSEENFFRYFHFPLFFTLFSL